MAVILSIESSTTVCSVALHQNTELLCATEVHIAQSASSKLAVMVKHLFTLAEIAPEQITAVAVSAGPGSYTGLRIGVALAKGICFSLNIPLISINTLELMAHQVRSSGLQGSLCPMIDARRMEVYCLLLDANQNIIEPTTAKVIDESSFANQLEKETIYFFGNGAAKCKSIMNHPNAKFLDKIFPSGMAMGQLAFNKFNLHQVENLAAFEPLYLKDFLFKQPKAKT